MAQSSIGWNDEEEDPSSDLPIDNESRASTSRQSPNFQLSREDDEPSSLPEVTAPPQPRTQSQPAIAPSYSPPPQPSAPQSSDVANALASLQPEVGQPSYAPRNEFAAQYAKAQSDKAQSTMRYLKDQGLDTEITPDGSERIRTHEDGAPIFKEHAGDAVQRPDGRWVKPTRDNRGESRDVDLLESKQFQTDPLTGDQFFRGLGGEPVVIGRDDSIAERRQLRAQRDGLRAQQQADSALLADQRAALEAPKVKLHAFGKTAEKLEQQLANLGAGLKGKPLDTPEAERYLNVNKALVEWKRANPQYDVIKKQVDEAEAGINEREGSLRERRKQIIGLLGDPTAAAMVANVGAAAAQRIAATPQQPAAATQAGAPAQANQAPTEMAAKASVAADSIAQKPLDFFDKLGDIKDNPAQLAPFVAGAKELYDVSHVALAAMRLQKGEASQEDLGMIKDYVDRSKRDTTFGYKVANVLSALPSFAGELFATGGLYTAGQKAAFKGGSALLKKFVTEGGEKLLEGKLAQFAAKTGASLVGSALQAPVAASTRIAADAAERMLPQMSVTQDDAGKLSGVIESQGDGFGAALKKAAANQFIEVMSERAGGALKFLPGAEKLTAIKSAVVARWFGKNANATVDAFGAALKKLGWHGVLGEMFEERVGDVARSAAGLQSWGDAIPTLDQLAVEGVAFMIPGAAIGGINMARGKNPTPAPQMGELHGALEDVRGKIKTARDSGDESTASRLEGEATKLGDGLHAASFVARETIPAETRRTISKAIASDSDFEGDETFLKENPVANFATAEIGRALRPLYLTPEREAAIGQIGQASGADAHAQIVTDQHIALRAVKDLRAVLDGGPIEQAKAQALEELGLLQTETSADGSTVMKVTDDALPLFPKAVRDQIQANGEGLNFTVTPGEPGDMIGSLVKAGQRRMAGVAQTTVTAPQPSASTEAATPGKPNFQVKMTYALPNGAGEGEMILLVSAPDAVRAQARAVAIAQRGGRSILSAQVEPTAPQSAAPSAETQGGEADDISSLSEPAQRAVGLVRKEFARNRELFVALGINRPTSITFTDRTRSGLAIREGELAMDGELLVAQLRNVQSSGAKPGDWIREALNEELIHRAQIIATEKSGRGFKATYEAVWNDPAMPPELRAAAGAAYEDFDALSDAAKGAEVVRMVIQGKWQGTITERIFKAIEEIVNYLKSVNVSKSELLSDAIARTEAVLVAARSKAKLSSADASLPTTKESATSATAKNGADVVSTDAVANEAATSEAKKPAVSIDPNKITPEGLTIAPEESVSLDDAPDTKSDGSAPTGAKAEAIRDGQPATPQPTGEKAPAGGSEIAPSDSGASPQVPERTAVEVYEVDSNGALVLREQEPTKELLREYSHTAGNLKALLDCLGL